MIANCYFGVFINIKFKLINKLHGGPMIKFLLFYFTAFLVVTFTATAGALVLYAVASFISWQVIIPPVAWINIRVIFVIIAFLSLILAVQCYE